MSQPNCGFFSEEKKHQPTQIEGSSSEGAKIIDQSLEGEIPTKTMVVVKLLEKLEGFIYKIDAPLLKAYTRKITNLYFLGK